MNSLLIVSDLLLLTVGIPDLSCPCQFTLSPLKRIAGSFFIGSNIRNSHLTICSLWQSNLELHRSCYETEDCITSQCLDPEQFVSVVLAYCCDDRGESRSLK